MKTFWPFLLAGALAVFSLSACDSGDPIASPPKLIGPDTVAADGVPGPAPGQGIYYYVATQGQMDVLQTGPEPLLRQVLAARIPLQEAWHPTHGSPCLAVGAVAALVVRLAHPDDRLLDFGFVEVPARFYILNCGINSFLHYRAR